MGMIILPIWFIYNSSKIKLDKEFKIFYLAIFFIIVSFFNGLINIYPSGEMTKIALVNNVVLIYGLLYYFFGKFNFQVFNINFKIILRLYIAFGFIMALVYFYNPSLYFNLRNLWTMSGQAIEINDSLSIFRYTGTYSDPNNASVIFVCVLSYLLFNLNTKFLSNVIFIVMTFIILVATMSSTGFILFSIVVFVFLIKSSKDMILNITKINFRYIFIVLLFMIFTPFLAVALYEFLFTSDIFSTSIDRVTSNSSDSRVLIWKQLLNNVNIFNYILIGMGGTIKINGIVYPPHNGHLHLIYSYGIIVYFSFMYIFFRLRKLNLYSYLFIFVVFVGFTVNVGIYEIRFIALFALLVSSIISNGNQLNFKK